MKLSKGHLESEKIRLAEEKWSVIGDNVEIFRLPGNEPVRRIITGRRRQKTGAIWSWKNMAHVAHESTGEEFCARVLELHPRVDFYYGQPEQIRFAVEGVKNKVRYTPDFLVEMGHDVARIEYKRMKDINPAKPLRSDDERGWFLYEKAAIMRARLRDVRAAYARADMKWLLVTDEQLTKFVRPETIDEILANCGRQIDRTDEASLFNFLAAQPDRSASLAQCEAQLSNSDFPRGDILSRIPEKRLRLPLWAPITPNSIVTMIGYDA